MAPLVTGAIGVSVAVMIFWLMRKDRLHVRHGLGWALVAMTFAFLGFAPWIIDKVAAALSIGSPPILALTLAISVLVIKIFLMDIERSRLEIRNQRLIQRIAMLEAELNSIKDPEPDI
jgi:hypothetical protein